MTPDTLAALAAFAFVASITPGPNNMMLLASGANFGFRRTLPHMLGINFGHAAMVMGVGLGAMALFDLWPPAYRILQLACAAYLLWLAWRIANAAPPEPGQAGGRPFTFVEAALFQWVNPKAWAMALGAITLYAPARDAASVLWVAAVFCVVNLPSVSSWAALGTGLRRWLTSPGRLRAFNWTMAAALVGSLALVL